MMSVTKFIRAMNWMLKAALGNFILSMTLTVIGGVFNITNLIYIGSCTFLTCWGYGWLVAFIIRLYLTNHKKTATSSTTKISKVTKEAK